MGQKGNNRTRKKATSRKNSSINPVIAGVAISHPDRILYPEINFTKPELAEFYAEIADWILPHLIDRPSSMVRCPGGQTGQCFYQKHFEGTLPEGLSTIRLKEKSMTDDYVVIQDITGLIALVQWGVLEFHPWGSRIDDLERPDRMVFDLDPGENATWEQVVRGVRDVRERLRDLKLKSFLRTSGGKGLHVVVPLTRRRGWEEMKDFAHSIATVLAADSPQLYVANMSKSKRRGRVFIDYLRNGRGATAIASYSTRARVGAPVATPLRWDELSTKLQPNQYSVQNIRHRIHAVKDDPWQGFFDVRQSLTKNMIKAVTQG